VFVFELICLIEMLGWDFSDVMGRVKFGELGRRVEFWLKRFVGKRAVSVESFDETLVSVGGES
jgi:hypothetical protein